MQMVFHLGVHGTDGDRLLKTLLNNRVSLLANATEVVPTSRYRSIFEEALMALNGGAATPDMEQIMLDAVLDADGTQRVIFSNPGFLGSASRAVGPEGLYPQIESRISALANLFPQAEVEFFLAIRNPATLLSELLSLVPARDYAKLMQGADPLALRWRDVAQRLVRSAQGRRVVIWCHEDVPLIWPEVVRLAGDIGPDLPLAGALLYMHELLGDEGLRKLRAALGGRDQMSIAARRAIYSRMLQQHALAGKLDQVVDLPDWTQEMVDEITRNYRSDAAEIAVLPGVEFILS